MKKRRNRSWFRATILARAFCTCWRVICFVAKCHWGFSLTYSTSLILLAADKPLSFSRPLGRRCLLLCREGVVLVCSFLSTSPATTQICCIYRTQKPCRHHAVVDLWHIDAVIVSSGPVAELKTVSGHHPTGGVLEADLCHLSPHGSIRSAGTREYRWLMLSSWLGTDRFGCKSQRWDATADRFAPWWWWWWQ